MERTIIRRYRQPMPGLPYEKFPTIEHCATPSQEDRIRKLREEHPNLQVVPHRFIERPGARKHVRDALVALNKNDAAWVTPEGEVLPADKVYPMCRGNDTTAHCIVNGYCARSPYACNE